jgi:hypothetical protein
MIKLLPMMEKVQTGSTVFAAMVRQGKLSLGVLS